MSHNIDLGKCGEMLAKNYLIRHGYEIVGLNIKTSYKEIDIVAKIKDLLVFVEVKTRLSGVYGPADEALTPLKIHHLTKAIGLYLNDNQSGYDGEIRVDFIAIDLDKHKKMANIKHYTDII